MINQLRSRIKVQLAGVPSLDRMRTRDPSKFVDVFGRQAAARTDRTQIVGRQDVARPAGPRPRRASGGTSATSPRPASGRNELAPSACQARCGLAARARVISAGSSEKVESTPPSARRSVKCFSMTRGAERDARDRDADAHRVVRQADLAAEQLAHVRDGSDVGVVRRGRIGAGALEQHEVAAAGARARRRTASSISATLAMPVEMIIGLPVAATRRISGRSVFSNEAIL